MLGPNPARFIFIEKESRAPYLTARHSLYVEKLEILLKKKKKKIKMGIDDLFYEQYL